MSYMKHIDQIEQLSFERGLRKGFDDGWDAYRAFVEQKILDQDPAFRAWLDKLERLAKVQRERDELALQQQQWALQQADDDAAH